MAFGNWLLAVGEKKTMTIYKLTVDNEKVSGFKTHFCLLIIHY